MGIKPVRIIIETKLNMAIDLLKNKPDLTCFEISRIIGKPDEKALNKYFKRHTGNAPSFFREQKEVHYYNSTINKVINR